jgi:hypothetical protein
MALAIVRVLFGFSAACLAAGLVQVLFAVTPAEIANSEPTARGEIVRGAGMLWLLAATQSAVFASPFALVAAVLAEWLGMRAWTYYALAGLGIASAGYLTQLAGETGERTVGNGYALSAFLATGLTAGLAYWAAAGRNARRPRRQSVPSG